MNTELISRINQAFLKTVYPGDDFILVEKARELTRDSVDAAKIFMGRTWDCVDRDALRREALTAAGCLSLIGSIYYLPAICVATIEADGDTNLIFWHDRYIFGYHSETLLIKQSLTAKQVSVMHEYVLYIGTKVLGAEEAESVANNIWATPPLDW